MHLNEEEKKKLEDIYQSLLHDERIMKMKDIPMHRGSNCYIHVFKVAKLSIKRAIKRKHEYDLKSLLYACILHDYYLYDWRVDKEKRKHHASRHPYIAVENAKRDFNISPEVEQIILSHMWPINIKKFPKTREAKMLMHVDNVIATREFLTTRGYKKKKEPQYLEYISKLFD